MAGFRWDSGQTWDSGWFWDQPLDDSAPPFYPGSGNGKGFADHESAFDVELAMLTRNRESALRFVQFIRATDLLDS